MVLCIFAFVVFAILGLFSVKYRELAKEAFACVFTTIQLKKCETGFDQKLKSMVSSGFFSIHPKLGTFVFKHFQLLSNLFVIISIASLIFMTLGFYNYLLYGNCNGSQSTGFCIYNPETYNDLAFWKNNPWAVKPLISNNNPSIGNPSMAIHIVEVGCFTCPFTRQTEPLVKQMLAKYNNQIFFEFHYFPIPSHPYSLENSESAECAREQGSDKFWAYHDMLFDLHSQCTTTQQLQSSIDYPKEFKKIAETINLDVNQFESCVNSNKYKDLVEQKKQEAIDAGIYGTPTFYVNGRVIVSPTKLEELTNIIDEELAKNK